MNPISWGVWGLELTHRFGLIAAFSIVTLGNASVILPIPTDAFIVLIANFYNPLSLGVATGVGAAVGESTAYFVGRGGEIIIKKRTSSSILQKAHGWFQHYGWWVIPTVAFTPIPFDPIGIVSGFARYNFPKFFLGCLVGKVPRCIIIAYTGKLLSEWIFTFLASL